MNRGQAIVMASVARAMIRMEGMKAENRVREYAGRAPAHDEDSFLTITEEEGIGWNAVVSMLNECGDA